MTNSSEKTLLLVVVVGFILVVFSGFGYVFVNNFHLFPGGGIPRIIPLGIIPLIFLAVWIFVIMWVYRDAETRGMSGILWALLVFVGSVIGLLIYLLVRNNGLQNVAANLVTNPCQNCGKPVLQNYPFCPNCGAKVNDVCPSCGKAISNDWLMCAYCGKKLDVNNPG